MDNESWKRKTLVEQAQSKFAGLFLDSTYWRFIKYDPGIAFLDSGGEVPPFAEVSELFDEIQKFYEAIQLEYGSVEAANQVFAEERERQREQERTRRLAKPKTAPQPRSGFVYLLYSNGVYKIGITVSLDKRITQISPTAPYGVELVHSVFVSDMDRTEKELHERFKNKRLNGEWFALTDEDVEYIKGL